MEPLNFVKLLENSINEPGLGWTLCFIGEDQSRKLAELTQELRREFSQTGDGKEILSGFSYWGIGPTIAWNNACNDRFYLLTLPGVNARGFLDLRHNLLMQVFTNKSRGFISPSAACVCLGKVDQF
jgi:hypothetical protein